MPGILSDLPTVAFNAWKHHPITQLYFRFMLDHREAILEAHAARWAANAMLKEGGEDEARGAVQILEEFAAIELIDITSFYEVRPADAPDDEEESEKQTEGDEIERESASETS